MAKVRFEHLFLQPPVREPIKAFLEVGLPKTWERIGREPEHSGEGLTVCHLARRTPPACKGCSVEPNESTFLPQDIILRDSTPHEFKFPPVTIGSKMV